MRLPLALLAAVVLVWFYYPLWFWDRLARAWGRKIDTVLHREEVQLRHAPRFFRIFARFLGRAGAITLSRTILLKAPTITWARLQHELVHVDQWRRRPRLFPLLYLLAHRRGRAHNRYEQEAEAVEQRAREKR